MVPLGYITRNQRVIRIHIMHRKPQIAKSVARKFVVLRSIHKHPVTTPTHVVSDHLCARRIPDINAVATIIHAAVLPPLDDIAGNQNILCTMYVDTYQISKNPIAFDHRVIAQLGQCNSRIKRATSGTGTNHC